MRKTLALLSLLYLLYAGTVFGQTVTAYNGICESGNVSVSIFGTQGSRNQKFQQSFPSCTVTVYLTGTTTPATIYSSSALAALGNPFTAQANGRFQFFAISGAYDVQLSGAGIVTPFTISSIQLGSGAGGSQPWTLSGNILSPTATGNRVFIGTGTFDSGAPGFVSIGQSVIASSAANSQTLSLNAASNFSSVESAFTGGGTYKPLAFLTNGSPEGAFDTSGNFLVGNNYSPNFTADDAIRDIGEFWRTLNDTLRVNLRNDSTGTGAETSFTARAGAAGTSNAISMNVTGSSFAPVSGISASQGSIITGTNAINGLLLKTFAGSINLAPTTQTIVTGTSGLFSEMINGVGGAGLNLGLEITAGTNTSDFPLYIRTAALTPIFSVNGRGDLLVGSGSNSLGWTSVGGLTVTDVGNTLTWNGSTGALANIINVNGGNVALFENTNATSSFGVIIQAGTGSGDFSFEINNYNGGTTMFYVGGDGQVKVNALKTTGSATGKKVVCVDTSTGQLYASSAGNSCAN